MKRNDRALLRHTLIASLVIGLAAGCTPWFLGGPTAVLDHYLCYFPDETGFNPPNGVSAADQFNKLPTQATFVQREYLCNPVDKRHGWWRRYPIKRPEAHLFCYRFDRMPVTGRVEVNNQFDPWFGAQPLVLQETFMLCLPSGKGKQQNPNPPPIPPDLDHFKCYRVKPDNDTADTVTLKDQFLNKDADVRNAIFLCNPARKTKDGQGPPRLHPDAHLVCYSIGLSLPQPQNVRVANQFEPNFPVTVTKNPPILCVPSTKRVIDEPQPAGSRLGQLPRS